MKAYEMRLAAQLLDLAADQFANHSCNDFDLVEAGLSYAERLALIKAVYEADGDLDEATENGALKGDLRLFYNWWLMRYLADRLRATAPFCTQCGAQLPHDRCETVASGLVFCAHCGRVATERSAHGAERCPSSEGKGAR